MSAALYRITIDALAAGATTLLRAEAAGCVRREGAGRGVRWRLA